MKNLSNVSVCLIFISEKIPGGLTKLSCTQCNRHGVLCTGVWGVLTTVQELTTQVDSATFKAII